ncbi:hypothetical protein ACTM8Z_00020 [Atopobiaceae bacterium HCP3S3_D6]
MPESTTNNTANVSAAKGVKGGYVFSAPVGTKLPTDYSTPLDQAFKCLGFISEDGYVETVDEDSDDLVDMNGAVMDSTNSNRVESAQVTFAEIKAATLKRMYGDSNVTDGDGMIVVRHNSDSHPTFAYVLELLLKNDRRWRKVVPEGKSSELDDLTLSSSELASRPLTIKYLSSAALDGDTCRDYIQSTETEKA